MKKIPFWINTVRFFISRPPSLTHDMLNINALTNDEANTHKKTQQQLQNGNRMKDETCEIWSLLASL